MSNYSNYKYNVSNREGYELSEALRLWKTKFDDFKSFKKDVITHEGLEDFGKFVEECWNDIKPVTVQEALKLENTEHRRIYFDCIGVKKLFETLKPKLRDRQVITKKRTKWDDNLNPVEYTFDDVYELYQIDGEKLFGKDKWGRNANPVFAVRCWCTTTNREYWIYVNNQAAIDKTWWSEEHEKNDEYEYDAIRAIAWTVRVDVPEQNIEKIYRQGDIIIVKLKDEAKSTESSYNSYHLNKQQYLNLMYSET
jgi:hypothetical protein